MKDQLESIWSSLYCGTGLTGKRPPGLPPERTVYLAVDSTGARHLCVRLEDAEKLGAVTPTRGLMVAVSEMAVGDTSAQRYVDLACSERAYNRLFCALAADLIHGLKAESPRVPDVVVQTLRKWRSFWSLRPAGLTQEEALGLFGELWFLCHWLKARTPSDVAIWTGPGGARHDFQRAGLSAEVKTYAGSGAPVHRISGIEQLADPVAGRLLLFSMHVMDDELGNHTLPGLVSMAREQLAEEAQPEFIDRLATYGYSPEHDLQYGRRLRVVAERLYEVTEGFPRITAASFPTGLPNGIDRLTYDLQMSACDPWLIATNQTQARPFLIQVT